MKVSEEGAAESGEAPPPTVRLMGTMSALPVGETGVNTRFPLYSPVVRPVGLAVTVMKAGVVPLIGFTDSQAAEEATVKVVAVLLVMVRSWEAGREPLPVDWNDRDEGEEASDEEPLPEPTRSDTGMVTGLALAVLEITTLPW